ncbi:hypothetical protein B0H16DRAFT_1642856 [Mycena metata]|uniref:Uncharacterized protein n=1 Tax=Mycena metata TaxID=1033252 RepID=A0AAD7DXK0_9AGAR|nr:hypothetical protein B0H16DRAFT_1642856 [Mycena metata]
MAPRLSRLITDAFQPTSVAPVILDRGISSPLSDDDTLMDWDRSSPSHSSVSPTAPTSHSPLKRKRIVMDCVFLLPHSLLNDESATNLSPDDSSPRKKSRLALPTTPRHISRNIALRVPESSQQLERTFRDAGTSPPPESESPSDRDSFVTDMESCLDSILNQLAGETQRREVLQEQYASFAVASDSLEEEEPASSPTPTDFFLSSSKAISDDEDELSRNMFDSPFSSLHFKTDSSIDKDAEVDVELTLYEPLESNALRDVVADDDLPHINDPVRELEPDNNNVPSTAESQESMEVVYSVGSDPPPAVPALEFDTWWAELNEIDKEDELWSIPEHIPSHDSKSRCPCNQCSPQAASYPDISRPSRHSQQEIHRLFLSSPFAHRNA